MYTTSIPFFFKPSMNGEFETDDLVSPVMK